MGKISLGKEGESLAAEYLQKKGYKVIEKNFRTPFGEIDIIAKHKNYIVIVEVKTRMSDIFGEPAQAINHRKQERLKKLALYYLSRIGKDYPVRFDVIAIKDKEIEHIENAFY
ncbi:MAG: YraN family protein [Thermodesulfovibrio sp.]|nr:YraN family protein [Thermodesulfovibrio sp.]